MCIGSSLCAANTGILAHAYPQRDILVQTSDSIEMPQRRIDEGRLKVRYVKKAITGRFLSLSLSPVFNRRQIMPSRHIESEWNCANEYVVVVQAQTTHEKRRKHTCTREDDVAAKHTHTANTIYAAGGGRESGFYG